MLEFHGSSNVFIPSVSIAGILGGGGLERRPINRSVISAAAWKQRHKLAQAFFSDAPVLVLDEPPPTLITDGIASCSFVEVLQQQQAGDRKQQRQTGI